MKHLYLALAFILLFGSTTQAQNLVPNPSFEQYINCPVFQSYIDSAADWYNPTGYSPDYYHGCAPSSGPGDGNSVPNNWYGVQTARTGQAYAGIITFIDPEGREYIQAKLKSFLITGKKYKVEFYVCLADTNNFTANDIGAYFSNTAVSSVSDTTLPYIPQISNNPISNPLTTMNSWTKISGSITAQGGEEYITLGNFKNDTNTDTTHFQGGSPFANYAYYFIDDVSVILDTTTNVNEFEEDINFIIYPNPALSFVTINSTNIKNYAISLINSIGEIVIAERHINQRIQLDLKGFTSGIYLLQIQTENKLINRKIIITN